MKSHDSEGSLPLLDRLLVGISLDRKGISTISDDDFDRQLSEKVSDANMRTYFGIRRELAKMPRTEIYKVPIDLSLPEQSSLGEVLDYRKFCQPWVVQFVPTHDNEPEVVVIHVTSGNGEIHYFLRMWAADSKNDNLCFSMIKDDKLLGPPPEQESIPWIMQLFLAMKSRQYINVIGKKNARRNKLSLSSAKVDIKTISLNEAGRRYKSEGNPTFNTHFKDGKIQVPVEIEGFQRIQRVGKGRTETKVVNVRPFERNQWIVPKDKIFKVKE